MTEIAKTKGKGYGRRCNTNESMVCDVCVCVWMVVWAHDICISGSPAALVLDGISSVCAYWVSPGDAYGTEVTLQRANAKMKLTQMHMCMCILSRTYEQMHACLQMLWLPSYICMHQRGLTVSVISWHAPREKVKPDFKKKKKKKAQWFCTAS